MNTNYYAIIMAGGVGSRFWPLSRKHFPKQFLKILGTDYTFLQDAYNRMVKIVPKENILVVTRNLYEQLVWEQLPDLLPENLLLEPFRRNTAPCIAYAVYKVHTRNPKATLIITPSDHYIPDVEPFTKDVLDTMDKASGSGNLFTLGIKPTRAETGYGYIQVTNSQESSLRFDKVKTFTEKPNQEVAELFFNSGDFYWNSGIFIWETESIISAFQLHQSEIAKLFSEQPEVYDTEDEREFIRQGYNDCPAISIDYGIMEKAENVMVTLATFNWYDLGTWESLYIHGEHDKQNNMVINTSDSYLEKSSDNIIYAKKDKFVVIEGLENYLVVDTDDALLICPRHNEVELRNLLNKALLKVDGKYS